MVFTRLGFIMVKPAFGEAVTTVFEPAHLPPLTRKGVSVELHTRLHGEETTLAALQQLEKHLDDRVSHESATQTHLFYLRKITSTTGKLNYLREVLLPGKRVMVANGPD